MSISEWEDQVLASMTRDQLLLFGKLHEAHGELRRANVRLRAEVERLRGLAAGAGMALVGKPDAADVLVAQDLIAQMLEEQP